MLILQPSAQEGSDCSKRCRMPRFLQSRQRIKTGDEEPKSDNERKPRELPSSLLGEAPNFTSSRRNDSSSTSFRLLNNRETDPHRISQRQKQIDFGKNTLGYERYCKEVPKYSRAKTDPMTPDPHSKRSKRSFEGLIIVWRRELHKWDEPGTEGEIIVAPPPKISKSSISDERSVCISDSGNSTKSTPTKQTNLYPDSIYADGDIDESNSAVKDIGDHVLSELEQSDDDLL